MHPQVPDTPRLVVLVTGDIELYSLMVRDHFYDSLGDAKHEQAKERADQRHKMVDHLEDQYLLKLFPMHRRLQLRPLWNLLQKGEDQFRLIHANWNKKLAPSELIDSLIRRGLRSRTPEILSCIASSCSSNPCARYCKYCLGAPPTMTQTALTHERRPLRSAKRELTGTGVG